MPATAKPVQYVKICSLYGEGFYYIPGTDTCIKLGGYLRVQVEYNAGAGGTAAGSGSTEAAQARFARDVTNDINHRTRAALSWDVRQETEYGTLRTYIRFGVQVTTPVDSQAGVGFSGIGRSCSSPDSRWAGRSRCSISSPTMAPTATTP